MTRFTSSMIAAGLVFPVVLGSIAFAAQDRYTLKLGKLSFGDFEGYENWKNVAVSQTETFMKAILANDLMIDAYKQGLPAKGKVFPDGVKIVKIEWSFKRNPVVAVFREYSGHTESDCSHRKRHETISGHPRLGLRQFQIRRRVRHIHPRRYGAELRLCCHTVVADQDYIFTAYPKR